MTRTAALLLSLLTALSWPAPAALGADLKLEERKFDTVTIRNVTKPFEGTIEEENDTLVRFLAVNRIRYTWPRSDVVQIKRRCTLRESYQQATKTAGTDPVAHLRLYELCVEAKLEPEALAELRRAVEVDPKYLPAYEKLVEAARAAHNLDMELGVIEAAVARLDRPPVSMLLRKAEICVQLGLLESAEEPLRKALELAPLDTKPESRLALLELARGRTDRAEAHVRSLLRHGGNDPDALLALGQFELARGNLDKATDAFSKAADGASSPSAAASLGVIAMRKGDLDAAAKFYALARTLDPACAPALAGEGLIAALKDRPKDAAELLAKAAAAAPRRTDILVARAYAAERAADYAEALKLYDAVIAADSSNVYALTAAGRCHGFLGDLEKARAAFERALSLRPGFVPALRGLGRAVLLKTPSAAVEYLRKVVESAKDPTPEDRAALANALIRLQRFAEAAAELARAGSDCVHARIGLGFLAYAEGKVDDAIAHFDAAVKLGDHRGYAEAAIQRIRVAESRVAWSDNFQREDDAEVRNGWTEVEPLGVAIRISTNRLLIDGTPTGDKLRAELTRPEEAAFVSITAEAETGSEAQSFVGVFVAPRGGQPVLFGRTGKGSAGLLHAGLAEPQELPKPIPQGRFTVGIEIDRAKGTVRPLVDGQKIPQQPDVVLPEIAKAAAYDVGVFAAPAKGQPVNCLFYAVKIVRPK